jgi:polyvinyl alcohol dehydrogenase (cytochrome)
LKYGLNTQASALSFQEVAMIEVLRSSWRGIATLIASAGVLGAALIPSPAAAVDWPMFGQNLQNTASTTTQSFDPETLAVKWTFTTAGDVSARASVANGVVYFPDWGGYIYAVNASNGKLLWKKQLSAYGLSGSADGNYHSRTTPAVANGTLYFGTQEGAWLLAVNAANGALVWKTQLESADPFALITASPSVSNGYVYTGVASNQEALAAFVPGFVCCSARGSVVSVNASTGAVRWKTYTVPDGYSGGGVWGSNLVVDAARGTVYAGTGNNYSHPSDPAYVACIAGGGTAANCTSPANHVDSILALDSSTGAIRWATKAVTWNQPGVADGSDDWNVACFVPPFTNCPSNSGPDYDFASAPNLITYRDNNGPHTLLGVGQKSGIYYALNPDTGAVLWRTQVGPGSSLGGMEWGSASDGKRIYVQIANFYGIPTAVGSGGSWSALDPATGAILWQVGEPSGAISLGPLAVADGIVYAPSMAGGATAPSMFALSANSGQTLWSYASGSSVVAGATVVDGVVYWGSGYAHLGIPGYTGNNRFYAFSKNGK